MMKMITFATSVACVCFLTLNQSFAQEIIDPNTLIWNLSDFESAAGTPDLTGDYELDPQVPETSPLPYFIWAVNNPHVVDNPVKDIRNNSNKCLAFNRTGPWGTHGITTKSPDAYFDFRRWEYLAVDVLIPDALLGGSQFQLSPTPSQGDILGTSRINLNPNFTEPSGNWHTFNMDLRNFDNQRVMPLVHVIVGHLATNLAAPTTVYVDNWRLIRSVVPPRNGINDPNVSKVTVYPNPATEQITLSNVQGKVSIYNLLGVELVTISNYTEEKTINVGSLPSGQYIVKTADGVQKFIKK